MISLLSPKSTIVDITWLFIKLLNVNVSYTALLNEIEEHPFYPSLLAVSEVLSSFGIKNTTVKFDVSKIPDISTPFLVQLKGVDRDTNFFSIVKKNTKSNVEYYDPQSRKWIIENRDVFSNRCTGVVLIAEVNQNAGEANYQTVIGKENKARYFQYFTIAILPAILLIQLTLGYMSNGSSVFSPFIFSILYLTGGLISVLLILNEIGHYSPVVQAICGGGKKVNCNAVLNSNGAKIFGVSWSVMGFTYFTGSLIYILTIGLENTRSLVCLWQLNVIASVYIFYSVYYQWKIAKSWCVLCLSIQGVFLLISLYGFISEWYHDLNFSPVDAARLLTAFIVPFVASVSLYAVLFKAKEFRNGKLEFQRLKRNPDFFERNLADQKMINESLDGLGILLGNSSAHNKLVKVCNPYCNPCSIVHDAVEELLTNSNDLCVQIIFMATNDINDNRSFPVRHLLAIYASGIYNIQDALNDWHHSERKNYDTFAAKYPMDGESLNKQNGNIDAMGVWCEKLNISFTPTFFVNGHQLPSMYSIQDLKYYFLD